MIRFWNLENLTTFSGDQGYDFLIVKRMVSDGDFTLLGPKIGPYNEIGNLYLGPAYYYLMAPALFLFNFDPIGGAVLSAALAVLTIAAIYKFCAEFLSKQIGVVAALLYSTNSFLINQSRAPSNPHFLPFFSMVFLFGLFKSQKSNTLLWPIVAGLSLGVMFQLHYLSVALIPLALIFVIFRKYQKLLLLAASFFVAVSPQVLFELRNKFFITNLFLNQLKAGQNISGLQMFWDKLSLSAEKLSSVFLNSQNLWLLATVIIGLGIFLNEHKSRRQAVFFLLFTLFLATGAVSLYSGTLELHYFAAVYPQIVILIAIVFITALYKFKNFFIKVILALIFIQLITANLQNLDLNSPQGYTMPQGWNLPGAKKASKIIASDIEGQKFNVASTLDGDTRARPLRYLVEVYGKIPQDVEHYPGSQVIYLVARDEEEAVKKYTVWEISSFQPFKVSGKWDIQNGIALYKLEKN